MFTWQDTGTDTLWTQYGLGIEQMFGTRLGIVLGHGGDVPGYRTIMCYFPGYDTSLILLCNQNIAETAIIKCLQETMAAIPVNNVVSAGMENNRQTITMIEGQTLRIALASNPSTGYDWKYKENNPDFLIKKSAFYVPDDREGIITGGGGTSYWLLEAVQPGTTSLSLEYTSVSGSVDDTYSLGIEITAKPDSKFLSPWRERTCDNDVKADKEWAIRFNQPVARSTVNNNNIYVVDSEGNKVENNVDLDTKGNVRLVIVSPPESGYESGGTYTLYIKPDVANLQGQTLKNGIKMSFNIAGNSPRPQKH
jgi:predicted secreted protein